MRKPAAGALFVVGANRTRRACDGGARAWYRRGPRSTDVLPMVRTLLAAALLAASAGLAVAQVSWTEAIERVERSAEAYREYARARGVTWAGSMYAGWDHTRHSCAVVGRMIGEAAAIADLETMEYPALRPDGDEGYAHEMLVFSISLENWVAAARAALSMTEAQRINLWNVECAGTETCPACRMVVSDAPQADFVVDGRRLRVLGDIDAGFAARFEAALDAAPQVEEVLLGSNGGSVVDAIRAGLLIRERGLETTLHANCNSACPLVFLGGARRVVWAGTARLGLHRISAGGAAVAPDDPIYGLVARYVRDMGGDPRGVVAAMLSAPPEGMAYPEVGDYCDLGLATWVQRVCGR